MSQKRCGFYHYRAANQYRYDTNDDRYGGSTSSYRHQGHNSWGTTSSSYSGSGGYYGQYSYVLLVLGASYIGQRFFWHWPLPGSLFRQHAIGPQKQGVCPPPSIWLGTRPKFRSKGSLSSPSRRYAGMVKEYSAKQTQIKSEKKKE